MRGLPVLPSLREDDSITLEPGVAGDDSIEYEDGFSTEENQEVEYDEEYDMQEAEETDNEYADDDAWEEALLEEIRRLRKMIVQRDIEHEAALGRAIWKAKQEMYAEAEQTEKEWNERLEVEVN